jgi:alkanesulfonate monooxygenase SsuD/methylene tetrahydromethanopterin reductase-like flavin-dependent oxidoreductase (luciferase family)
MEFGIFSNGFRPHTSAARTYDEDIHEIVLADQLGFRDAYISEHHAEAVHIDAVDTIPMPELMMCKAAALTKTIRMGAAIKLAHLYHPLDVAVQAAITSHMLDGRFIFGFGTGFPSPQFCEERGLTYEDRHERLRESLQFIMKCWYEKDVFDWEGKHWRGKKVVALPKPFSTLEMATATDSEDMIRMAALHGWTVMTTFLEPASRVRQKGDQLVAAAKDVGGIASRRNLVAARIVHIAESREQALKELREGVTFEISIQAQRGFLDLMKKLYDVDVPNDSRALDLLEEAGLYVLGTPDEVAEKLKRFYDETGGFGTFLMIVGKGWATREQRAKSMRLFMERVAPQLRHLDPAA